MKNIENMCVSPGDGRGDSIVSGEGSPSKSDGNFIAVSGKATEKIGKEKGVIVPLAQ